MKGKFTVIIGPSASGKTQLVEALVKKVPNSARLLTTTTRDKRPNERHGEHYFFLTRPEFEKGIKSGDFFEHAEVYGNLYGTSKKVLDSYLEKFDHVFAIIDVQGAKTLRTQIKDSRFVFIRPGSIDDLEKRIKKVRPEMSEAEMKKRMATAEHELSLAPTFDAIITNVDGHFEETVARVIALL